MGAGTISQIPSCRFSLSLDLLRTVRPMYRFTYYNKAIYRYIPYTIYDFVGCKKNRKRILISFNKKSSISSSCSSCCNLGVVFPSFLGKLSSLTMREKEEECKFIPQVSCPNFMNQEQSAQSNNTCLLRRLLLRCLVGFTR